MELLRGATLVVADVETTAARYVEWLNYAVVERGSVPADLAASWGAPKSAGRASITLQPASGAEVFLRLVQARRRPLTALCAPSAGRPSKSAFRMSWR